MPTQAGRSLRYSDEAINAHWITPSAVSALAASISPTVTAPARQSILDIKVYTTLHKPTRQSLRSEPRFKKSSSGLGLFCARSGVIQPSTGLVKRLHTTADKELDRPESDYEAAELGLTREQWLFLCVPGTPNPFTGYGMESRGKGLRRDSGVEVPAREAVEMVEEEQEDDGYPDRWPRWLPADQSVTLTCPGCACELTGVLDHSGGVIGYGCSVCPWSEGWYEGEDDEEGNGQGGGVISAVGDFVGGSPGEAPVSIRPSLLHYYWDEPVADEKDNEEDMVVEYLEDSERGMGLDFVPVKE
ncbi:hypothetical protein MBLNU457_g0051t1 [Dothideomycetes sp. NU457]